MFRIWGFARDGECECVRQPGPAGQALHSFCVMAVKWWEWWKVLGDDERQQWVLDPFVSDFDRTPIRRLRTHQLRTVRTVPISAFRRQAGHPCASGS
jgi:hypothetical protein